MICNKVSGKLEIVIKKLDNQNVYCSGRVSQLESGLMKSYGKLERVTKS